MLSVVPQHTAQMTVLTHALLSIATPQVSKLLQYAPQKRYNAYQAMTHPFFDELRDPNTRLPNGRPLPPLTNWLPGELDGVPDDIVRKLSMPHSAAA